MPYPKYFIWSEEHQAWWRPGSAGYTCSLKQAGQYSEEEAGLIVGSANMGNVRFNEIALLVPDHWDRVRSLGTHR